MRVRKILMSLTAILMSITPILSLSIEPPTSAAQSTSTESPSQKPPKKNTPDVDPFLTPYSAVYSTVWKKGISLKVEGKQTLSKKSDNLWQFVFSADSMIASLDETSVFYVEDNQIIPTKYQYKSKVLGKKRSAILTFDWEQNLVHNNVKDKPWNLAINPNTLDKLSVQLQIRQDLKLGKNEFDYQIADGGYIKNWRFERRQRETINTELGRVSAIKIIRVDNLSKGKQTAFWFVPKFDYLLVKLEHKEDGESYQLDIDSFKQN
ncbi:hypothetical protein MUS1_05150 [Marinomonas ushuaiensis DSM 15871]|uniref:DUF3108 domain-containing protein n=1 Tax=Marinomonas ushuaiensis DSM 15871 TaxID=1122207 RepID=X7E3W5_9GAMM|nr:DUF3108 domain-containing protein [Marinomonas ushuaiensis]ETX09848.1 hypothetical protein MUS1_05150 [Marinomonas ushuaiensis DSM 15871]